MERVATLIERLQQQFAQHADAEHLMVTAQMLLNELQAVKKNPQQQKKVEVMLPGFVHAPAVQHEIGGGTAVIKKIESDKTEEKNNDEHLNRIFSKPVAEEVLPQTVENIPPQKIIIEPAAEINEVIAKEELSLNDKLKTTATELGSKLQETPVKDLRKAIGINDRYLFITELFRGDEAMFDRSLKTINTFSNGAEAEYWIQRELKVKLGWTEDSEAVQQFDQLVRRRFS